MSASEPLPRPPAVAPAPSDGTRSGRSGAAAGATASAGASAGTPPPARGSGPAPGALDPITLEVVCEGLIAIVREMRATIIRSSISSVIYELDDFSCALFGSGGEMVAQSWDHPGHVLPLPWGVRCMFEDFADDLHPGDVVLLNDPYRGGTHLNDVTMVHPIFDEDGNILVFPAVRAHWVDVGGMVPGSYSGLSTNIYQEGVRIPPIKMLERGRVNRAAMALLMANMRVPEEREGDFNASLGACRVAERRIRRIYERYGTDTVHAAIRINLDRTERRLRERIAELPDGSYCYEDYLEYYEEGRLDPVLVRIELTVDGDGIVADFAGSNPHLVSVTDDTERTAERHPCLTTQMPTFEMLRPTSDLGVWISWPDRRQRNLGALVIGIPTAWSVPPRRATTCCPCAGGHSTPSRRASAGRRCARRALGRS